MKIADAQKMKMGDYVLAESKVRKINSIKTHGIAAPYFRLDGDHGHLTSYIICQPHSRGDMRWSDELGFVTIPD